MKELETHLKVGVNSDNRIEMNVMWIVMGVMFVFDLGMIYYHMNMHKRVKALEAQLKNKD